MTRNLVALYEAYLFILLLHPAFNKYICSKDAILVRLVDLHKFLNLFQIKWNIIIDLIQKGAVNTAAWSTLYWLSRFTNLEITNDINKIKKTNVY